MEQSAWGRLGVMHSVWGRTAWTPLPPPAVHTWTGQAGSAGVHVCACVPDSHTSHLPNCLVLDENLVILFQRGPWSKALHVGSGWTDTSRNGNEVA